MGDLMHPRPSPAILVAVAALIAALAGTAIADPVANTAVSKKKIKKIAKKQAKKYFEANIGDASVAFAANAGNADTANRANSAAQVDTLEVDPENVPEAADQGSAPEVTLLTHGPFKVYGKCFASGGGGANTTAEIYIKTDTNGAVMTSDDSDLTGNNPGYLDTGTAEANRRMAAIQVIPDNSGRSSSVFDAVSGAAKIQGQVTAYAKNGNPGGNGNGTYGAGDRCIFDAYGTQSG